MTNSCNLLVLQAFKKSVKSGQCRFIRKCGMVKTPFGPTGNVLVRTELKTNSFNLSDHN
jgi:hypothetical protein